MRTYGQANKVVWEASATTVAATASINSGSFATMGYSRLTGIVFADASMSSGCGVRVRQSSTSTPNWDGESLFALSANSGSMFSIEITGKYGMVELVGGATCAASTIRTLWILRPV